MSAIEIIVAAVPPCVASIIMLIVNRNIAKRDKTRDEKDEIHSKERLLQMKMIAATMKLSEAVAIAARDGKTNGEMKAAMAECEEAKSAYYEFLNEQAYKHIA